MNKLKNIYINLGKSQKLILYITIIFLPILIVSIFFPKEYTFNCIGQSEKYAYIGKPNSSQQKEKSITEEKIFQITIYKYFFGLHHSMKGYKIYQCKKDWDDAIVCINEFVGEPFSSTINNAIHIVKTINSATYNSIGGINDGGFSKIYKSEETMEKTNTSEFFGYSQNIVTEKFTSKRCIQISNPLQN